MLNCSIIQTQHTKLLFLGSDYAESGGKDSTFFIFKQMLFIILVFVCYYALQIVPLRGLSSKRKTMKYSYLAIALLAATFSGCCRKEQPAKEQTPARIEAGNIKVTAIERMDGAEEVRAILERDRAFIDSIKSPVLGEAAVALEKYIPESPLMNFAADALMEMAQQHSKQAIDIAITNKGGLRSNIAAGTITFGDVYNVFTFENRLAFLTLDGEQLTQLCKEIAKAGGEAISGMRLTITREGELLNATVGGKAIEAQRRYRIATLDYLSQGNDNLTTLALGTDLEVTGHLLRDLMVEYIKRETANGRKISAACDGRITIKKVEQ